MDIVIRTGFEKIIDNTVYQPTTQSKGKQLVEAQHVLKVQELRQCGNVSIHGEVIKQTNVSEGAYVVKLQIDHCRAVKTVSCTCVYNKSDRCKHVAALIYYVNHEKSWSKTDHEQQWGKPSARQFAKDKYSKGKYFHEMFPSSNHQAIMVEAPSFDLSEIPSPSSLKSIMVAAKENKTEFARRRLARSMLKKQEEELARNNCKACIENLFLRVEQNIVYSSPLYQLPEDLERFYINNIKMTRSEIIDLCCDTVAQTCAKWHEARRLRISASTNAHSIKTRIRKSIDTLVKQILYPKNFTVASTQYGIVNESHAREEYEALYSCKVLKVGVLVSFNQPWLCSSFDGVVIQDGSITKLVEIKCPFKCKNKNIINYDTKECNLQYLKFRNGEVILKESSLYYTQCQVQLYLSGLQICDLFIYSPLGSLRVTVHRNERFIRDVVTVCEDFYFKYYLPALNITMCKENCDNNNYMKLSEKETRSFTGANIVNQI